MLAFDSSAYSSSDRLPFLVFEIRSVIDQQVEAAKLLVDTLCRSGDRSLIRHVDLKGDGARTNLLCSRITTLEVARPHQHSDALCDEFLCYLETDALIGSGDQGDAIGSGVSSLSLMAPG